MDLAGAEKAVTDLLAALGVDEGDHTADTPRRVAAHWQEVLGGYGEDPAEHLRRRFTGPDYAGLVVMSGVEVRSTCAHHLLPIEGVATVAYLPKPADEVVGLSKLARVVDGYARRLQVQERLGAQVADALVRELAPLFAACVITARHGCMCARGVRQDAQTTTYAWRGDADDRLVRQVEGEHLRSR